jgi:predicted DNA-binding protein
MRRRHETRADEPMTLTVHLPDDLEQRLRERASRDGRAVEEYVLGLIERDVAGPASGRGVEPYGFHAAQAPALTDGEFEHLLDELASVPGLPRLPADFSRADSYADHD